MLSPYVPCMKESVMELFDPRLGLVAAGAAAVSSERVRKTVGKGLGYAVSGAVAVGGPIARPLVDAGRDIFDEARTVASSNGPAKSRSSRSKATSAR
ncbi:MAG: hypothetical protein ACTHQQ_05630 [Solirubrobacteraceae bacterium]